MENLEILEWILDSFPYPIVFVDNEYIIWYINRKIWIKFTNLMNFKDCSQSLKRKEEIKCQKEKI